ncbi:MAG TPA: PAS domain S-box protein [Candidatus Kapabacteria bacterium]|nr:PAS domain S-box protein [Candidatus Kapabacteria bacterium]
MNLETEKRESSNLNLIIEAIQKSACYLISEINNDSSINNCLNHLGEQLNLSTIYVFNFIDDNNLNQELSYFWTEKNIESEFNSDIEKINEFKAFFSNYIPLLEKNEIFFANNNPDNNSFDNLNKLNIESLLIIPLFLKAKLWGYISFIDNKNNRNFNNDEINLLKFATNIFATALINKQCREKLNQSEQQYKIIVENAFDAIYLMKNKRYDYVNPQFVQLTGYSYEELTANNFNFEILISEESKKYIKERYEARLNGIAIDNKYEVNILRKDGITVPVEINTVSIGIKGEVAVLGIMREISERKRFENALKESEHSYRTLTENIPGLVYRVYVQEKNKVVFYNNMLEKFLGYSDNEIQSSDYNFLEKFILPEDKYRIEKEIVQALNDKQVYDIEFRIKDINGNIKYLMGRGKPVFDKNDNLLFVDGVFFDNTKQKEVEKELNETIASKDKFFSIIAHDLKGPLAGFMGYTKTLVNEFNKLTFNEIIDITTTLSESAQKLYSTLENLLEWSRTQTGRIEFKPELIDLREIAFNITYILKQNANDKNIMLVSNIFDETIVKADKNMITTVIRNLVANAIKFTDDYGRVTISAKEITESIGGLQKKSYLVSVEDNGIGIDDAGLSKLFRIDENVTSIGTSGEKGTGLGLILCKEFIEKHNGRIWAESQHGKGSSFNFTIPV